MGEEKNIPYKIYLEESEMPKQWYNVRADMKIKPAPLLNPATLEPMGYEDLRPVFVMSSLSRSLIMMTRILIYRRRFWTSIRCTDLHLL